MLGSTCSYVEVVDARLYMVVMVLATLEIDRTYDDTKSGVISGIPVLYSLVSSTILQFLRFGQRRES